MSPFRRNGLKWTEWTRPCSISLSPDEWIDFNSHLYSELKLNLPTASESYDVNSSAAKVTEAYQKVINEFMPLHKISRKQKKLPSKPWITMGLKISSDRKDILYNKAINTKSLEDWQFYKKYRNIFTSLKKLAYYLYCREKSILYGNDKSKTWRLINEISNRKKKSYHSVKTVNSKSGEKLQNSLDIANCFNSHFSSIGKNMASKFDEPSSGNNLKDPIDYVKSNISQSLYMEETNEAEILELISKLEIKKACGYDHITNNILKNTSYVIAPFLERLYNECIMSGVFPDAYKVAKVVPLFKGGDSDDVNSYRPISLLPALGKLLEKVISSRIVNFFDHFCLFSPHQFGFRAKFSTEHAILDIYEKLLKNLDDGLSTCAIFLDLAKAFDTVSHPILIRKLEKYGIRGNSLDLLKSYLNRRSQFVQINNSLSSYLEIEFGVPQGSILGPLLFLIFFNDLPDATKFFIRLFADDTFLCAQNDDIWLLESEVNEELKKVFNWLSSN